MVRATVFLGTVLVLFSSTHCLADGFEFSVDSPKFRISLPSVPSMKMAEHPMHAAQPQLRYLGSQGSYTVSVITPTAAAGMTPLECASATVRSMAARHGVPEASKIYKARVNENTFMVVYSAPLDGVVRLNAHLLSAVGGTHCIEVHASKMSESEGDQANWIEGFEKARIEPGR